MGLVSVYARLYEHVDRILVAADISPYCVYCSYIFDAPSSRNTHDV